MSSAVPARPRGESPVLPAMGVTPPAPAGRGRGGHGLDAEDRWPLGQRLLLVAASSAGLWILILLVVLRLV